MIRLMKNEDCRTVSRLLYDMYLEISEELDFTESMGDCEEFHAKFLQIKDFDHHYVYTENQKILGYYLLSEQVFKSKILFDSEKMCYLGIIVTDKNHRNQGIGTKLLKHSKTTAQNLGYNAINLEVLSTSEKNFDFYTKHGFDEMSKHMICFF